MNIEYAISAKWWREWCDYVNVEFKPLREHFRDAQIKLTNILKESPDIMSVSLLLVS